MDRETFPETILEALDEHWETTGERFLALSMLMAKMEALYEEAPTPSEWHSALKSLLDRRLIQRRVTRDGVTELAKVPI